MRAQEAFSGVRVLTWICMPNHFHVLVAVELGHLLVDDVAFLARLKPLYAADAMDGIGKMLKVIRGRDEEAVDDDDGLGGRRLKKMRTFLLSGIRL
ncbi:MAG: hypothetical protein R3F19_04815 [Verrucomicrobiales bacterium]